jgi:lactoylglutathione lyase
MTTQPTTLGAFSVSLAVKDLPASRAFYEKLDFKVVGGDAAQNWLILRNGNVTIGLFQGMFERNLLTFNPGWDEQAQAAEPFTDVREHQRRLKSLGLAITNEADDKGTGPASFILLDPDGNPVLIDQHVPLKR